MYDVAIRGGTVVDGTGRSGYRADVAIVDGRVVTIGALDDDARETIDAQDRVVGPGFIDVHTHYDAQLFWDPTCSPSPLHGVTTIVAGNCGITLAPVTRDDEDFMTRLLSRVEAIPLECLTQGLTVRWSSFPEFLDVVARAPLAINVGFLVGHSALRRFVMGERASSETASDEQLAHMQALLGEAIAAGALGFSSSKSRTQLDGDGRPTPPNFAADAEFVALSATTGGYPGTSLEYIPESAAYGFDDEGRDLALMSAMSCAADRQVNWNTVLLRYPGKPDIQDLQLASADVGDARGATIVPMIIPHNFRVRTDFLDSDTGFRAQASFRSLFAMARDERLHALQRSEVRAEVARDLEADTAWNAVNFRGSLGDHVVSDVGDSRLQHLVGHSVAELAAEGGATVLDTIFDVAVDASLDVGFVRHAVPVATAEQRALRRRVLRDTRLVLGASDGGAHVRGVINAEYSTASFAELVRDDDVFTVEELVQEFTDVPARLYGLSGRGRLEPGAHADVVVFDPDAIDASPVSLSHDLPGGAARLFSYGVGVDTVLVGGTVVAAEGEFTEARPGRLLRSGRDTYTPDRTTARDRNRVRA